MPPPPLLLLIAPVRAFCFGGEDHLKSRRRASPRTDDDQDGWRPGWTSMKTDGYEDRGRPGWTTRMDATRTNDDDENRRRRLKTEDRRRRGEEAGNRTVALLKRQSTLAVDLLKMVGNTSHKWCAASAWSVSTALSSLHICWVIKRSGPSRYYCPPSDVGGPKRTVDKDGRLSEDGDEDG
ncbi:hypothetical protein TYRP_002816 [Tyrophagus putrescentiae]|nr:hypothetical protein TYRP_002816 [Tyrophagus putrescentiae]